MTSGPVKKGKLWFHTALDPFYTNNTIVSLPSGQNRTSSFTGSDLTRFQWNVSDRQTLTGSLLYNRGDGWRDGLSILNPAETTVNDRSALMVGTIKDQFIIDGNLIEAGFANTRNYVRSSPLGSDPYELTPYGTSGNFFRDQSSRTSRQEGLINAVFRPVHYAARTRYASAAILKPAACVPRCCVTISAWSERMATWSAPLHSRARRIRRWATPGIRIRR